MLFFLHNREGGLPMSLHVMAERIAFFLVRKEIIGGEKCEICSFGLELILATLINAALVTTASLALGVFPQTVLMLIPFMLVRGNAGGFHAKTHIGCMAVFTTVYIIGALILQFVPPEVARVAQFILLPAAALVILFIGALPHKNRPVSSRELAHFKVKARLLCFCILIAGMTGLYFAPEWFVYYALGVDVAAGSLLAGYIQNKYVRRCEK